MKRWFLGLLAALVPVLATAQAGTGLLATYHEGGVTNPVLHTRVERPNFTWPGSPAPGVPADYFAVKWIGTITAPATGTYQLQIAYDGGTNVRLDGLPVAGRWAISSPIAYRDSPPIEMVAGVPRNIIVDFRDTDGSAHVSLKWRTPSNATWMAVPLSALSPPAPTIPYPLPAPVGNWTLVASINQLFTLTETKTVRFGPATDRQYRQIKGAATCSPGFMGWYGANFGVCEVFNVTQAPTLVQHPAGGPLIDLSKIPFGSAGTSQLRISATSEQPKASDVGSFRTVCDYSYMAFDDPIVKPGQPGASHLHVFYGNTGVNAASTASSIATTGNSTCRGGIANRSAYWIPAVIDTLNGAPIVSHNAGFYYKSGYYGIEPNEVNAMPAGLRMIAGDAMNSTPNNAVGYFECSSGFGGRSAGFINCPAGNTLTMHLDFPQCWDGTNLDSPDHRSHMSYPVAGNCPASHPVALPVISFIVDYPVTEANEVLRWRFSSDTYSTTLPGGYSMHGDWFNGWQPAVVNKWITQCVQPRKDCGSHLLGGGEQIF